MDLAPPPVARPSWWGSHRSHGHGHGRGVAHVAWRVLPVVLAVPSRARRLGRKGGRVFGDISKVMSQEDLVDYSDEQVPAKPQADDSERWHSSQRAAGAQQALQALQRLHGRKIESSTASQDMAPPLATAALEAFDRSQEDGKDCGRDLRSELQGETFDGLRSTARNLLARRSELTEPQLEIEVRSFLKSSWSEISLGLQSDEAMAELRVAQLLGAVLAQVPDPALSLQFEKLLKGWAKKKVAQTSSRAPVTRGRAKRQLHEELEDLRRRVEAPEAPGEERRAVARRILKLLMQAFLPNASKAKRRRAQRLSTSMVSEALAAVAKVDAQILLEHWETLPDLLVAADPTKLWPAMADAPVALRLAVLEAVALDHCAAADVVQACLDFVFREDEELEFFRHIPVPKRPRTKKRWLRKRKYRVWAWWGPSTSVRLTGLSLGLPTRKPLSTKEWLAAPAGKVQAAARTDQEAFNAYGKQKEKELAQKQARKRREDEASAKRAGALLQWLEDSGDLPEIEPKQALQLVLGLGRHLGSSILKVLQPWLEDAARQPRSYAEAVVFQVAQRLRSQAATASCWKDLAEILLARWSQTASSDLTLSLEVVPVRLMAAPNALRRALLTSCEADPLAWRQLSWPQLTAIMEAWEQCRVPIPLALRLLWVVVADPYIVCFKVKQLVKACRLASADDLLDLELPPQVPEAKSLALAWWDRWLQSVLSNETGWAFCREALRQALAWQRWARRKNRRDEVPRWAAAKVLLAAETWRELEVPTELLLDLLEMPTGMEEKLTEELTRRVQDSLGNTPLISMGSAVALAHGKSVPCPVGSLLWSGVVASIAQQLTSSYQVRAFLACQPSRELYDAVTQVKEGSWQSLELKMRRPFS